MSKFDSNDKAMLIVLAMFFLFLIALAYAPSQP